MPGPYDIAKGAWNWANTPLVPPSQTVDKLAQPGLNDSPGMARLKGFGSGALEGLRGLTSPVQLAGLAGTAAGVGGMMRGARAIPQAVQSLADITPDLVEPAVIKQVMPAMDDVDALIGGLKHSLAKIPPKPAPLPTPVTPAAEFVHQGGEAAYNAARPKGGLADAYQQIMGMRPQGAR